MDEIILDSGTLQTVKLEAINVALGNWDFKPVEGKGLHISGTNPRYGHIQLKMYASTDKKDKIIWNISEQQLPSEWNAKAAVKETLEFFIKYFAGIKGKEIPLTFEINDGSFHPVDSHYIGYLQATLYAIIDCFDKDLIKFRANRVAR